MNSNFIFVYNANSGVFEGIKDLIHKSVSPKTYGCNLCGLTFSGASMKREWREFIDNLAVKTTFLHKDEFVRKYPRYAMTTYPAVFIKIDGLLKEFISTDEINKLSDLGDLKQLVQNKISEL